MKTQTRQIWRILFVALLAVTSYVANSGGAEFSGQTRPLKCVYFSPADCTPNPDRAERLYRVMANVQEFYRAEMERNGFGSMTTFGLEEEEPGKLKLYHVQAPEEQSVYGRNSAWQVRNVVAEALAKMGIDVNQHVVVIFQQGLHWDEEGRATEVASFVGAGSSFNGTAWFYDDPMLDPEKLSSKEPGGYYHRPCSVGEFNSHYIGGIAHELGHALTLPHDCETSVEHRELGSALMGGGNHTYGRELRGEGKGAFLTYSEALRLSVVPAISGLAPQRRPADVALEELKAERLTETSIKFTGKINASKEPLALVFYEDLDSRQSDYDAKTWTTVPDKDGAFEITLTEASPEPSELRISAVRDIDTISLFKVAYNPNGAEGEFEPIERSFKFQAISNAVQRRDAETLKDLAQTRFVEEPEYKELCEALIQTITNKDITTLSSVHDDVKSVDLTFINFDPTTVGWARLGRGVSFDGVMLRLGDHGYASGLCAHAPSVLGLELNGQWSKLRFGYGLQDNSPGSVVFVVRGDGQELFRSELVRDHERRDATIDVSKVKTLELVTEDGGNGNTSDHSIWVEPTLER
ncbi:MAG: NPCBM/NEW2 domain-containing protein [Planctomycetia bacterium]|nr:NPCBM/NEW2 domain-containing protein [Planctomycetia bacterium]